jgi:hypothetical protein
MQNRDKQRDDINTKRKALRNEHEDYIESSRRFINQEVDALQYYWRNDSKMKVLLTQLTEAMYEDEKQAERLFEQQDFELAGELKLLDKLDEQDMENRQDSRDAHT